MILHIYHTISSPSYLGYKIHEDKDAYVAFLERIQKEEQLPAQELLKDIELYKADAIDRLSDSDNDIRISNLFIESFPFDQEICVYRESGITYLCLNIVSEFGRINRKMFSMRGNVEKLPQMS